MDNIDRYVAAGRPLVTRGGTVYDLRQPAAGPTLRGEPAGSALEQAARRHNIARVCDGDLIHKPERTTLPRRVDAVTVADCQRWYAAGNAD